MQASSTMRTTFGPRVQSGVSWKRSSVALAVGVALGDVSFGLWRATADADAGHPRSLADVSPSLTPTSGHSDSQTVFRFSVPCTPRGS
jgi:hypothetical protein